MYTEVDLPNPDNLLRPGMYGITRLILDTDTKKSTLSASCIVGETKGDKADVYIIKDGKAHKVSVRIGADDGLRVRDPRRASTRRTRDHPRHHVRHRGDARQGRLPGRQRRGTSTDLAPAGGNGHAAPAHGEH